MAAGTDALTRAAAAQEPAPPAAPAANTNSSPELAALSARLEVLDRIPEIADRVSGLEQRFQPAAPPVEQAQPTNWFADPDKAMAERTAAMVGPMAFQIMESQAALVRDSMANDESWRLANQHYKAEVDAEMAKTTPAHRTHPDTYRTVASLVLGRHVKDILGKQKSGDAFFVEPAAPSSMAPPAPRQKRLTPEHQANARRMGKTDEEYIALTSKLKFVEGGGPFEYE